ncbi:hypothetical protein VARIO8X_80012 [Burkholderiales bacterium 8X]|nr:hypothetical protein VARIO8X_80012 [Burkholderiales bacterium 8X]
MAAFGAKAIAAIRPAIAMAVLDKADEHGATSRHAGEVEEGAGSVEQDEARRWRRAEQAL